MKFAIASDHAGFEYKEKIKALLKTRGHDVQDFGTNSTDPCDYPDFVKPAAKAVSEGTCERGILVGGSGNGEAMTANRYQKVRCAVCWNEKSSQLSRSHNNANMLAIGQRMYDESMALKIVEVWLTTDFEGGRHIPRIGKFD